MARVVRVLWVLAILLLPRPAAALFHLAVIDEVASGVCGDPAVQYVEIRMTAGLQTVTGNSVLTAFSCDGSVVNRLLVVPGNIANGGNGVRWIMASAATVGGMTADFVFPASPGLPADCGQVCWGAPGFTPPNPDSWDNEDPNQYVDCVAYGGYTGPTKSTGVVTASGPGEGSESLTRSGAGIALAPATPQNNAGAAGMLTCGTTSTTLPGGPTVETPIAGTRLLLADNANQAKRKMLVIGRDTAVTLGGGNGSTDDPTQVGAFVAIGSTVGGATLFNAVYELPADGWKLIGPAGKNKGYRFKGTRSIRSAMVRGGKLLQFVGKGDGLGHTLASDPTPVDVVFGMGATRQCMRFGGTPKFKAGKRYIATNAAAPGGCTP